MEYWISLVMRMVIRLNRIKSMNGEEEKWELELPHEICSRGPVGSPVKPADSDATQVSEATPLAPMHKMHVISATLQQAQLEHTTGY